jgi:riboflavin synthase
MFTGIITDLGRVRAVERAGDARFEITTAYDPGEIDIGASIGCSGVCLTVVDKGPDWFAVNVSAETMSCTTLAAWREGTAVNLERSLRVGDELGGHIVIGHVDGVAEIVERRAEGDSIRFAFVVPEALKRFVAPKGAIALDGISLTVNEVEDARFGVNIIPHTQTMTTFADAAPGDRVNVEVDVLARYVARLSEQG